MAVLTSVRWNVPVRQVLNSVDCGAREDTMEALSVVVVQVTLK